MATKTHQSAGETLKTLQPGPFLTLESRLARGGSLQARKLSAGAIQFYWRYSHEGKTSREPIGIYDPLAPPKKDQPTVKGYSIAAALRKCDEFALVHAERANSGGLQQAKVEELAQRALVLGHLCGLVRLELLALLDLGLL